LTEGLLEGLAEEFEVRLDNIVNKPIARQANNQSDMFAL
jgi:hypothetical protein